MIFLSILFPQNNLLPSGEKFVVAKSLVIDSVNRHEAGVYTCEAKNGVGIKTATASIKLQVLCKFFFLLLCLPPAVMDAL